MNKSSSISLGTDSAGRASDRARPVRGPSRLWFFSVAATIALLSAAAGVVAFLWIWGREREAAGSSQMLAIPAPYSADRSETYLRQICDFGPRPSGSEAFNRQRVFLEQFFQAAGASVERQPFSARHPETGDAVEMNNLIARFFPDRPSRYLICCHYDTRPFPDRDPVDPKGLFLGANDGGSGVAALMELSQHLDRLPPTVGVDLVFFDGEELVYADRRDTYFLGSTHFAKQYATGAKGPKYRAGILLDMIGDKELKIYYERNSWNYARDVCKSVFETAAAVGADAFVPRIRHEVRDDHLPLNQIAKIPTIDLIDFDYPRPGIGAPQYWHTTKDVPEHCSGQSIATVVYVVHQWLMRR